MAFSGGAKTHDKADAPFFEIALIWVRHDGGVKEGRGLYRVFMGKTSPDQKPSLLRERRFVRNSATDLIKVPAEHLQDVLVARGKVGDDLVQALLDLVFCKTKDTVDDMVELRCTARHVRFGYDPGGLRKEPLFPPAYVQGFVRHGNFRAKYG